MCICLETLNGDAFAQLIGGLPVELRDSQIEPAQGGIAKKRLQKISVLFFLGGKPVVAAVKHGHRGRMEIVDEGAVGTQRLLELSQGEARVGGEERACCVHRFENHLTATAAAHAIAD